MAVGGHAGKGLRIAEARGVWEACVDVDIGAVAPDLECVAGVFMSVEPGGRVAAVDVERGIAPVRGSVQGEEDVTRGEADQRDEGGEDDEGERYSATVQAG